MFSPVGRVSSLDLESPSENESTSVSPVQESPYDPWIILSGQCCKERCARVHSNGLHIIPLRIDQKTVYRLLPEEGWSN